MFPDEARAVVQALGGPAIVARGLGITENTVRRMLRCGAGGTNAAALRLAYYNADWKVDARNELREVA